MTSLAELALPSPRLPTRPRVSIQSIVISAGVHLIALGLVFSIRGGVVNLEETRAPKDTTLQEPIQVPRLVFLPGSLPKGGGGGGGGNRQPGPIRHAESIGKDAITLRIAPKPSVLPALKDIESVELKPDSLPHAAVGLLLDAKPLASGTTEQIGLPEGGVGFGTSTGPGSGGGVGDGVGTGIGSGQGPGFGPGSGGGTGGGVYHAGGSVTAPRLLMQVQPMYTPEALSHRIQGSVVLELVVTREGRPSAIRVLRSLDRRGLDEEAIKAVQQWRFAPGRLADTTPVDVLVSVIIDFSIR
jgi:protein TonB